MLSLLLSSTPAQARTAVVPRLHGQGVDPTLLANISELLADEVRFHDKYSEVILLSTEESNITPECLRSTRCVYKHAKKKGSRVAVAGKVFVTGDKLEFYLVLCDRGYFKRNLRFQIDNDILAIAEGLSPYVKELILGKSKKKKNVQSAPVEEVVPVSQEPIILNEDEQVDIQIDDSETENLMGGDGLGWGSEDVPVKPISKEEREQEAQEKLAAARKQEAKNAAIEQKEREAQELLERVRREKEEQERLERERKERERLERERKEQERLEREKRKKEEKERLERERKEQERLKRERKEQERLERERKKRESAQSEEEKAAALLAAMRREKDQQEANAAQREEEKAAALLAAMRKEKENEARLEPVEKTPNSITSDFDFDSPTKPKKKKKAQRRRKTTSSYGDVKARVTARIGVSKFQTLPAFITYGGEISYFPIPYFDIVVGAEGFATRRLISSDLLEEGESTQQWNTILPINVGGLYHFDMESIIPYIGADIVMLPGYVREASSMAMGMRLRTGIDFPVADTLHFNINLAVGFLSGKDFQLVQADLQSFGALPQFSAGTSFLF